MDAPAPDPALTPDNNAVDQGRALSVAEAWAKAKDAVGEPDAEVDKAIREGKDPKEAEAAAAKPAKPKPAPAKDEDAEPAATGDGKRDYVQGLAALRRKYERKEADLSASFTQREAQLNAAVQKYTPLHEAAAAFDAGDLDGFAAAIARYAGDDDIKDWTALQGKALQAHNNPAIREVAKLRREREQERRQAAEQGRQAQAQQAQAAQQAQERQWVESISDELTTSDDAGMAALVEVNPGIAGVLFNIQREHHQKTGEVLPTAAACEQAIRGLHAYHQKWSAFFVEHKDSPFVQKILGVQATAKKPASGTASRNGAERDGKGHFIKKPPPNVSQNRTAEASATGRLSDDELRRQYARKMDEAARQDFGGH